MLGLAACSVHCSGSRLLCCCSQCHPVPVPYPIVTTRCTSVTASTHEGVHAPGSPPPACQRGRSLCGTQLHENCCPTSYDPTAKHCADSYICAPVATDRQVLPLMLDSTRTPDRSGLLAHASLKLPTAVRLEAVYGRANTMSQPGKQLTIVRIVLQVGSKDSIRKQPIWR